MVLVLVRFIYRAVSLERWKCLRFGYEGVGLGFFEEGIGLDWIGRGWDGELE